MLLIVSLCFVLSIPVVGTAQEDPPPLSFPAPPDTVVVPSAGAYVYLVPNMPGFIFRMAFGIDTTQVLVPISVLRWALGGRCIRGCSGARRSNSTQLCIRHARRISPYTYGHLHANWQRWGIVTTG